MKKILLITILLLTAVLCFSQNQLGVATLFQIIRVDGDDFPTETNMVWVGEDKIVVNCWFQDQEYSWQDSITSAYKRTMTRDIDDDGVSEEIKIIRYYTDNNITYAATYINNGLVMISTESQTGTHIHFIGRIASNICFEPTIIDGKWVTSTNGSSAPSGLR